MYFPQLQISTTSTLNYTLSDYGNELIYNKAKLINAFNNVSLYDNNIRALIMSMAMLETNTLNTTSRDTSKDKNTDGSTNVSLFNLNVDMIQSLGYNYTNEYMNDPDNLDSVINIIIRAFMTWGFDKTLNFVRGGRKGFVDSKSYGSEDYRNTIVSIMNAILKDQDLMHDSRRVEIYLNHV